jgi:hypothetical protein
MNRAATAPSLQVLAASHDLAANQSVAPIGRRPVPPTGTSVSFEPAVITVQQCTKQVSRVAPAEACAVVWPCGLHCLSRS